MKKKKSIKKQIKKLPTSNPLSVSDLEAAALKALSQFGISETMWIDDVTYNYLEREMIKREIIEDLKKEVEK
jgi:hypothetical protein